MKRVTLALAIAAIALPGAALAKGPSAASIDGPGTGGGLTIAGCCSPGSPAISLAEHAGFFPAVFRQEPDVMLASRPKGDLGPKYTITYTVPGPDNEVFTIRQDVYPYASPVPVTYMKPGQPVFATKTRGGWFQAGRALKQTLVSAGVPATAAGASSEVSSLPTVAASVLVLALLLVSGTAILLRRRTRPAPAA